MQTRLDFLRQSASSFEPTHPKGYFQPGVLVLSREGRVLYHWRSVLSRKIVGGARVRPTPSYIWSSVEAAFAAGKDNAGVACDDHPEMDSPSVPWPLFILLLIANGWFVRAEAFAQKKNGPTPM